MTRLSIVPDYLGAVLADHEAGGAAEQLHRQLAADTARTLLGDVVVLVNRAVATMNQRLGMYGLTLSQAEALPDREWQRSQVRVTIGADRRGRGVGRDVPRLVFTVSPHKLQLGEVVATVAGISRLIGTRNPAELAAGVERAVAELADAGLRHATGHIGGSIGGGGRR